MESAPQDHESDRSQNNPETNLEDAAKKYAVEDAPQPQDNHEGAEEIRQKNSSYDRSPISPDTGESERASHTHVHHHHEEPGILKLWRPMRGFIWLLSFWVWNGFKKSLGAKSGNEKKKTDDKKDHGGGHH